MGSTKSSRLDLVQRPMPHWGLWVWFRYNRAHAVYLLTKVKDVNLFKLIKFLELISTRKGVIPHKLFNEGKSIRVTKLATERKYEVEVNESRFREIITNYRKDGLTGHNSALIPILENDYHSLAIEVPLWVEKLNFKGKWLTVTGHIDLLQYDENEKVIWIWDYKPEPEKEPKVGDQVLLYKYMLTLMTDVEYEKIRVGWFNEKVEYIIKDNKIFPFK